jgi:tetratricopeptide (TPR) repeat protein
MALRSTRYLLRGLTICLLVGCGSGKTPTAVVTTAAAPSAAAEPRPDAIEYPIAISERTTQQRYESELAAASAFLKEEKLPEAYGAVKRAQAVDDTLLVKSLLASIEGRAEFSQTANTTAAAIVALIAEGRIESAGQIVRDALRVFGGSGAGPYFAGLQRQTDALVLSGMDPPARGAHVQKDLEEAIKASALRSAVLAFEQGKFLSNEARVRRAFDDVRTRLRRFEDAIGRAYLLRRDASRRREFQLAVREATELWPTLDVARIIDDVALMDQCTRDRVVLLDFDVHGTPSAFAVARAVARDLTAALHGRYDVVDRSEWMQVLTDLGLTAEQIVDDNAARREFALKANVRYVVLGDVFASNGLIVLGRILDGVTGSVVQTSRIVGIAPDSMDRFIPQFVAMLLMSDEQRWDYESQVGQLGNAAPAIAADGALPKMPESIAANAPPRVLAASVRHAAIDAGATDAIRSQLGAATGTPKIADDHPLRDKVCAMAIERGDDLLRRGMFLAAHAQYQRAYGLSRNPLELSPRLDRCRAHVLNDESTGGKPRLLVCDFAVPAGFDSPGAGPCLSDLVAAYASSFFSVIDRAELHWCMERLGLTLRDVATDPSLRFYLARALDARYIAMGMATRDASGYEAGLAVVDAEIGPQVATMRIRAETWPKLRRRLDELANPANWTPESAARRAESEPRMELLLSEAAKHAYFKDFGAALELAREAVQIRPDDVRSRTDVDVYERQIHQVRLADERELASIRRFSFLQAERAARTELLRRVEAARAPAGAQPVPESDRVRRRDLAQLLLISQARTARSDGDYELAAHLMAAAIALQNRPELEQEFAQIRRQTLSQMRVRLAQEATEREQTSQRLRDAELREIKTRLEYARNERAIQLQAWTKWRDDADRREHARLLAEARSTPADHGRHLWLLQSARRLSAGGDTERLVMAARLAQARAVATQQGTLSQLEARFAAELEARPKLDAEARRNLNFYTEALKNGQQALRFGQFERADRLFTEAMRYVQSDDALRGLRAAQDGQQRSKELEDARASTARAANVDVAKLLETGRAAFEEGRLDDALNTFRRARTASPDNEEVAKWIARTEKAQVDQLAAERRRPGELGAEAPKPSAPTTTAAAPTAASTARNVAKPAAVETTPEIVKPTAPLDPAARLKADFDRLVDQGRVALSFRRFDEAELALDSALRLMPSDPDATVLLSQARKKIGPPPEFVRHMQSAAAYEKQDRFGDALAAYKDALRIAPNDPIAARRAEYSQRMDAGFKALRANNSLQAAMEFESALRAVPNDAAAIRALRQAQIK